MDVKTISEAFVEFLQDKQIGTFGENLYLNQVPADAPNACYWIVTNGGSPVQSLRSGEKVKQYFISVYYRSTSGKDVERNLFALEELLNCNDCVQLTGYEVLSISANQFPSDADLDNIERRVGFLQANIQIYKKEC